LCRVGLLNDGEIDLSPFRDLDSAVTLLATTCDREGCFARHASSTAF